MTGFATRRGATAVALLFLLAWFAAIAIPATTATAASRRDGPQLLGVTNVWTLTLTFSQSGWGRITPEMPAGGRPPGPPDRGAGDAAPPRGPAPGGRRGPPRDGPPPGPGRFGIEFPWSECVLECDGERLEHVAIRHKGNSSYGMSRGGLKKPFKIDFNRNVAGRVFRGIDKLSLNNNFNDATQFRESLAYEACRLAGLPAPRTAFARVYLTITGQRTNEYLGLYTLVEGIEGSFLKEHFKTKHGLLLKPERLRSLDYLGEDWRAYTNRYQPKEAVPAGETRRFIELTRLIAQADDATFARELPLRLDVAEVLRYVAVTALLGNYDSFIGNGHNYYLFQPDQGGRAAFIPWDFNEAFGGHPMAGTRRVQAGLSVLHPASTGNRLVERMLANPEWAAAYRAELERALAGPCESQRLTAAAGVLAGRVREAVVDESYAARAAFDRIALGRGGAGADRGDEDPLPGPGGPGMREDQPLADWIALRTANAKAELEGRRQAPPPSMTRP